MNINFNRSENQIRKLNEKIRPVLKRGLLLKKYYHITMLDADADYQDQQPLELARNLVKLREVMIELPTRGYTGYQYILTARDVLNKLSNSELKGATNYCVVPQFPKEYVSTTYHIPTYIDAKVEILGPKSSRESKENHSQFTK